MAEPAVTVTEARKLSFLRADFQIWFGVCMLRVVGDAPRLAEWPYSPDTRTVRYCTVQTFSTGAFHRPDEIDAAATEMLTLIQLSSALVRAPLLSKVCASAHETHAATLVATEAYSTGSCMLETVALSEDGLQMRSGVTLRPLLKALIVPQARHQGIGTIHTSSHDLSFRKWRSHCCSSPPHPSWRRTQLSKSSKPPRCSC